MKKPIITRYDSPEAFGRSLGLSDLDMALSRRKSKIIEQLKEARLKKGWSQAKLAALVGTKQPAIARMEAGQVSQVSLDFLFKVSFVLGIKKAPGIAA